jgi:hypothetical protein
MRSLRSALVPFVSSFALLACGGGDHVPANTEASVATATSPVAPLPSSSAVAAAPAASGANPCEAKVPGVVLKKVGAWVPHWDDGAGCEWSKEGLFWGIHLRLFPGSLDTKDKLTTIDDLKGAAPMMTEIGTSITKVLRPPTKTAKGWHTLVQSNEGKSENFVYVQPLGSKTLVCAAVVKSDNDMGGVPEQEAIAACDSIVPKP